MVTRSKKKTTKKKVAKKKATRKTAALKKAKEIGTGLPAEKEVDLKHGNSKFDEKLIPVIKNLALRGNTYAEIAELLDTTEKTLGRWRKGSEELRLALEEAKGCPIKKVEQALFKRAVGYSLKETKTHLTKCGLIKTKTVVKNYPPSETAMKYYLGNKDPENWKEKQEIDLGEETLKKGFAFKLDVTPEELK